MIIGTEILSEIERKAKSYDDEKEKAMMKVNDYIKRVMDKLKEVEKELLHEIETLFGENPFIELLGRINSGIEPISEEEVTSVMSMDVPLDFGPDEESLNSLLKEIDSFKAWKEKQTKPSSLDLIPKDVKCVDLTCNSVTLRWREVCCDCIYEIGLSSYGVETFHRSVKTEHTLSDLMHTTEYHIRVRSIMIKDGTQSPWSDLIVVQTEQPMTWKKCL